MSPILVRPVREQLEHDRVIRLLQAKYKRKFEVAINPGNEQTMPVGQGPSPWFPDLVLQSTERSRKLLGVVEVETAESVNHLEAMSQWAALSKLRAAFHLYIPASAIDSARRLVTDHSISVAEMWAYHAIGDQIRFTLVQRTDVPQPRTPRPPVEPAAAAPRPAASPRPSSAQAPRPASGQAPRLGSGQARVAAKPSSNGATTRGSSTRSASESRARAARPPAAANRRAAAPAARKASAGKAKAPATRRSGAVKPAARKATSRPQKRR